MTDSLQIINIKFHENPSSGSRVVPCGRTDGRTDRRKDRHDQASSRSSQFGSRPEGEDSDLKTEVTGQSSAMLKQMFEDS